jgi:MFS family permease
VWFITANLLATAAISPFVGALSDLMGRRYVAIIGSVTIIAGQIICGAARDMDMFIGECSLPQAPILLLEWMFKLTAALPAGMAITGIGTGINELTALAGTAELVPLSHRGYYIAGMVLTILPFLPSAMYAQMIAVHKSWRWISVVTSGWALAGLVSTVLFYFPPPRARLHGWKANIDLLKKTDFVGGLLSIVGLAGFEVGILAGGYQVSFLSVLIFGI